MIYMSKDNWEKLINILGLTGIVLGIFGIILAILSILGVF